MATFAHATERVFPKLEALSRMMTACRRSDRPNLDLDAFEALSDHLIIIRAKPRFGDFKITFYGSVLSEIGPLGELADVQFGDLLNYPFYRSALMGYRHCVLTGLPIVTRNHVLPSQAGYFTRLVIPIYAGNQPDLLVAAVVHHDQPLAEPAH